MLGLQLYITIPDQYILEIHIIVGRALPEPLASDETSMTCLALLVHSRATCLFLDFVPDIELLNTVGIYFWSYADEIVS